MSDDRHARWLDERIGTTSEAIPPHSADRVAARAMARVRAFIGVRELLYFGTLGFLYSGRKDPTEEKRSEDADR
jgi:hypothetical protein